MKILDSEMRVLINFYSRAYIYLTEVLMTGLMVLIAFTKFYVNPNIMKAFNFNVMCFEIIQKTYT